MVLNRYLSYLSSLQGPSVTVVDLKTAIEPGQSVKSICYSHFCIEVTWRQGSPTLPRGQEINVRGRKVINMIGKRRKHKIILFVFSKCLGNVFSSGISDGLTSVSPPKNI